MMACTTDSRTSSCLTSTVASLLLLLLLLSLPSCWGFRYPPQKGRGAVLPSIGGSRGPHHGAGEWAKSDRSVRDHGQDPKVEEARASRGKHFAWRSTWQRGRKVAVLSIQPDTLRDRRSVMRHNTRHKHSNNNINSNSINSDINSSSGINSNGGYEAEGRSSGRGNDQSSNSKSGDPEPHSSESAEADRSIPRTEGAKLRPGGTKATLSNEGAVHDDTGSSGDDSRTPNVNPYSGVHVSGVDQAESSWKQYSEGDRLYESADSEENYIVDETRHPADGSQLTALGRDENQSKHGGYSKAEEGNNLKEGSVGPQGDSKRSINDRLRSTDGSSRKMSLNLDEVDLDYDRKSGEYGIHASRKLVGRERRDEGTSRPQELNINNMSERILRRRERRKRRIERRRLKRRERRKGRRRTISGGGLDSSRSWESGDARKVEAGVQADESSAGGVTAGLSSSSRPSSSSSSSSSSNSNRSNRNRNRPGGMRRRNRHRNRPRPRVPGQRPRDPSKEPERTRSKEERRKLKVAARRKKRRERRRLRRQQRKQGRSLDDALYGIQQNNKSELLGKNACQFNDLVRCASRTGLGKQRRGAAPLPRSTDTKPRCLKRKEFLLCMEEQRSSDCSSALKVLGDLQAVRKHIRAAMFTNSSCIIEESITG